MPTQNIYELVDTWNNAATTFTSIKMNVTGPSGGAEQSAAGSLLMDLQVGGSSRFNVGKTGSLKLGVSPTGTNQAGTNVIIAGSQGTGTGAGGSIVFQVAPAGSSGTAQNALATALTLNGDRTISFADILNGASSISVGARLFIGCDASTQQLIGLNNGMTLRWGSGSTVAGSSTYDLILARDTSNTLALRNGANAQTFRVYNTTDGTNSEFGKIAWSSNVLQIGTEKAGTGTARALEFQTDGTTRLTIAASGPVTATGALTAAGLISTSYAYIADNNRYTWASLDTAIYRDASNAIALRDGATGTNAQNIHVYGTYTSTTNYQRTKIATLRESSGALSGASYTTTIAIPAYANLIGVTTRVTTAITGATSYSVGDGTTVGLWGAAIGVTLGSQSRTADFTAIGAVGAAATSRTVTLTANGSNFTGGVVEICLHYLITEAD